MVARRASGWDEFAAAAPELAAFGAARFGSRVGYLATVRRDGWPRVHPFTPLVLEGGMFCFMRSTSPKGRDLRRDPRFAVHCSVDSEDGGLGEFYVTGRAQVVEETGLRARIAADAGYDVLPDDILFEFRLMAARSIVYEGNVGLKLEWRAE